MTAMRDGCNLPPKRDAHRVSWCGVFTPVAARVSPTLSSMFRRVRRVADGITVTLDRVRGGIVGKRVELCIGDRAEIQTLSSGHGQAHETAAQSLATRLADPSVCEAGSARAKRLTPPEPRDDPRHPQQPVILWQTDPRRGRLVVACCPVARQFGVRPGIAIAQATELVIAKRGSRVAPPLVQQHDRIADAIALEQVASVLQHRISPLIALESLDERPWAGQILHQADTLLCDLSGVTHLFGEEADVLSAVHQVLAELGLNGKLAVADNAAAAWAHAHESPQRRLSFRAARRGSQPAFDSRIAAFHRKRTHVAPVGRGDDRSPVTIAA